MRIRDDDGQATVEHIGLVAVIALVLISAGTAAAFAGPSLFNRVSSAFQKALCTVTGEACVTLAREPCPTLRTTKIQSAGVTLGAIDLGHHNTLFIERRSDGTYVMSLTGGASAGLKFDAGDDDQLVQAAIEASFEAGFSAGRTYFAATPEAAAALVLRLRMQHASEVNSVLEGAADWVGLSHADPSVTAYQFAGDGAVSALAKFGLGDLFSTGGAAKLSEELGVRVAAHHKQVTAFLKLDGQADVFFKTMPDAVVRLQRQHPGGSPGGTGGSGGVRRQGNSTNASTVDLSKSAVTNPLSKTYGAGVVSGGSLSLQYGPGPTLQQIEITGYAGTHTHRTEVHARLDPSDPAVRAALKTLLAHPTSPSSYAALGQAGSSAAVDLRTFADTPHEHDHAASLGMPGISVAGHFGSRGLTSRLIREESLPVGGVWENRLDCATAG